jgi:hypothetical protein
MGDVSPHPVCEFGIPSVFAAILGRWSPFYFQTMNETGGQWPERNDWPMTRRTCPGLKRSADTVQ